jgi:hypothetical protein
MYTGFAKGMTEAIDASIVNRATQDLGAVTVWPVIAKVPATGAAWGACSGGRRR